MAYPVFLTKEVRPHFAWENIGFTREQGWNGQDAVTQAFIDAGMNYTLIAGTPTITLPDGTAIPYTKGKRGADKTVAVIRPAIAKDNQPRVLGMVSRKYFDEGMIQPMRLAKIADPLAIRWSVTAVGALDNGAKSFIALDLGERSIELFGPSRKGDTKNFRGFIFIVEDHSGGGAVQYFYGEMDLWCKNQFLSVLAGNRSAGLLRIPHHGLTADLLELRAKVEVAHEHARQREDARLRSMAAFALTEPMVDHILKAAYPDPAKKTTVKVYDEFREAVDLAALNPDDETLTRVQAEYDYQESDTAKLMVRAEGDREEAREAFAFYNETQDAFAGSALNLWGAITEKADYGGNISAGVGASVLTGERAKVKVRALNAISEVIGFN